MADEAQIKLLKGEGVQAWNEWRNKHLVRPDLIKAELVGANLGRALLRGANLSEAGLSWANLREANLSWSNLVLTNFGEANLRGADLSGANLTKSNLRDADLSWAHLHWANLKEADLGDATLNRAILVKADFSHCTMSGTQLGNVDLSRCKGLETVRHRGPSTIGIDTIYRSGGNIPESFLRGAGVPEPFIVHMKSLVAAMSPIEFYSCFISYSSKDQEFAERLHSDLRSKNIRCWFAPEDLKIGDKLRPSFDEAIRLHDKLMVLLSEHSVESPWVEKEVETAFEKERQQKRTVLFPVRLDDAVMDTDQAWAADIRRTRHIGDFRNWKDHDLYKKAFDRLLRDLKAE
jgi:uncharacterized protein YjbI with pentapeptide repeats